MEKGDLSFAWAVTLAQSKEHTLYSLAISFAQAVLLAQNMDHTLWILSKIIWDGIHDLCNVVVCNFVGRVMTHQFLHILPEIGPH